MKSIASILACSLILIGHAAAQYGSGGPPPAFKIVDGINKEKGEIVFREISYKQVPVEKQIVEIVNGQAVTKKVTVYELVSEQFRSEINAANSRIITPDGKQLPIDEVWKRVKAKSVVVVSANSDAPAQAYLRALSAETIVIIPAQPKLDPPPVPMKQ